MPITCRGAHDVTVHLLAACANRSCLKAHGLGLERYIAKPLVIEESFALAPDRLGYAIASNWKRLAQLAA